MYLKYHGMPNFYMTHIYPYNSPTSGVIKILDTPIQGNILIPYEFKWIEELGAHMIQNIEIFSGGVTLANYPGEYLSCLKERDFSAEKKELWDKCVEIFPNYMTQQMLMEISMFIPMLCILTKLV